MLGIALALLIAACSHKATGPDGSPTSPAVAARATAVLSVPAPYQGLYTQLESIIRDADAAISEAWAPPRG